MSDRAWGWIGRFFLPVSISLLVLAASIVPLPAFIQRPGSAVGIPPCVAIDERPGASVRGDYLFTTISQREATVFSLLAAAVLDDWRVVPRQSVLGGRQRQEYLDRQRQVFLTSTQRAVVVGLEAAGLPVDREGDGARVVEVLDDAPAAGVLREGDIVTAVDGTPVETNAELIAAVDGVRPLELAVRRDGRTVSETVVPAVRDVGGERRPVLGVRIVTHAPQVSLPLSVDVRSGEVGGPSAGLMIALAVHDLVDGTDLAAGRTIAGTGTLSLDGAVGRIDSVGLKVLAAIDEGADVFLAPAGQADLARAAVPDDVDLRVVGVATFAEAREQLRAAAPVVEAVDTTSSTQPADDQCRFERAA